MEFMCAWLCRWKDQKQIVPAIVALSIHNWINGTQLEPWKLWQRMRWLYCRTWTQKFCIEMAAHLPPPAYRVSKAVHCEGADNNFVLVRIATQRVGASHENVDMIQRVLFAVPYTEASEALIGQIRTPCIRPASLEGLYEDFDPVLCMLTTVLIEAVAASMAAGRRTRAAERPPGVNGLRDWKELLRPMAGHSASESSHIGRFLNKASP
jgi:hypothetical protein